MDDSPSPPPLPERASSVSVNRHEEVSEVTWKSSHPTQDSTPITRANSDISLHPPVRRRSILQTPGVATRTRPGPVQASRKSSFRYSHPSTPNLSRQVSFESVGERDRVLSMPILPSSIREHEDIPRAPTPVDGEYRTTGAFKLGSLRITNGSPVETSGLQMLSNAVDQDSGNRGQETKDYFSVAQPHGRQSLATHMEVTSVVTTTTTTSASGTSVSRSQGGGTLTNVQALAVITNAQTQYTSDVHLSPSSIQQTSPFGGGLETTSKHTAFEDDLFGIEDTSDTEISAIEVLDVRLDPNAKPATPRPVADLVQETGKDVARSDSGFGSTTSASQSSKHSSLAKADSGYSSNVSVRSLRGGKKSLASAKDTKRASSESKRDSSKILEQTSLALPELTLPGPTVLTSDDLSADGDKGPTPSPKDQTFASQISSHLQGSDFSLNRLRESVQRRRSCPRKPVRQHTPSPIDSTRSADRSLKSTESVPPTPASAKSDGSASSLSIGSCPPKPGKLQRFLSFTGSPFNKTPLPTVHVTHVTDDRDVPSIPQEVRTKLREHAGLFPSSTKRLALKNQPSKDTLRTIFSVGSLELVTDENLAPAPAPAPAIAEEEEEEDDGDTTSGDSKEKSLMQTLHSVQSSVRQVAASVIPPRKPVARKPVPAHNKPQTAHAETKPQPGSENMLAAMEAQVTTYGFVNSSLGNNAYDTATQAMTDNELLFYSPTRSVSRTMSMTAGFNKKATRRSYSLTALPATDLDVSPLGPVLRTMSAPKKGRTSPPVSMSTRRSLRVPAPIRPKSAHSAPRATFVAMAGREQHVSTFGPEQGNLSLSSAPPIPPMSPRRSAEHNRRVVSQGSYSQYRSPNWNPHADPPRPTEHSRNNSLSSAQSGYVRRSTSARQYGSNLNVQTLKHRASYDGSGRGQLGMGGGYFTQPAHQTQTYQHDPWKHSQPNPKDPHVPRGHHRNESMGSRSSHSINPPYRILHSYNSPAYRNVPIWG